MRFIRRTSIECSYGMGPSYPQAKWLPNSKPMHKIVEDDGYGKYVWSSRIGWIKKEHTAKLVCNLQADFYDLHYELDVREADTPIMIKAWIIAFFQEECKVVHADGIYSIANLREPGWPCGRQWRKHIVTGIPVKEIIFPEYTITVESHEPFDGFNLLRFRKPRLMELVFPWAKDVIHPRIYELKLKIRRNNDVSTNRDNERLQPVV